MFKNLVALIKNLVAEAEATARRAQLFRLVRLVAMGLAATYASGTTLTAAVLVGVLEVAFRTVFPS